MDERQIRKNKFMGIFKEHLEEKLPVMLQDFLNSFKALSKEEKDELYDDIYSSLIINI